MIDNSRFIIFFILVFLVGGCAHGPTQQEYDSLDTRLVERTQQLETANEQITNLKKELEIKDEETSQAKTELQQCKSSGQELLDRNIQCLEENKVVLQQISKFKGILQERKTLQWRVNKTYEYILAFLNKETINDQVYIIKSNDKVKIVIPQRVLFPTPGSAWLTPKGTRIVSKIAQGIKKMEPGYIEIAGHTDNTPIPPATQKVYPSNWHLGQARALSVLSVFQQQGVRNDLMCTISYGDTRPMADNNTTEGKSINRRVEIIITP